MYLLKNMIANDDYDLQHDIEVLRLHEMLAGERRITVTVSWHLVHKYR